MSRSSACGQTSFTIPQASAFCARDHLAAEDQLLGPAGPDQPGEVLGAAEARDDPQGHFGKSELGVLGGVDEVAGQRQFQPAAQCVTVDRCDHRLGHLLDEQHDALPLEREPVPFEGGHGGHFLDVGPGDKGLLPGPGDDDHLRRGVLLDLVQGALQLGQSTSLFRALRLRRTVDRDAGDAVVNLAEDDFSAKSP